MHFIQNDCYVCMYIYMCVYAHMYVYIWQVYLPIYKE